ncbi:MAG: DUF364 domain-containing protein [Thermodesulfobacteriota bacterium]|nr:DUF364 domain-containing protein [Thermodesulfobacteriota bacterium]
MTRHRLFRTFIPTHQRIVASLVESLAGLVDHTVREAFSGAHLTAVWCERLGLASWPPFVSERDGPAAPVHAGLSCKERAARDLPSSDPLRATVGLAALNALLPVPQDLETGVKAQDLIASAGRGKSVAVIGHFPFVARLRDTCQNVWVLELRPRPGDLPASEAERVLPLADVVAVTGTTLANGTLGGLLEVCSPGALKILLGPSTPLTPVLFDFGLNVLAGVRVWDPLRVREGILSGRPYRKLKGLEPVLMRRR